MHDDDIVNVLILNKKSISNQENQLFQAELDKFRPHQNRLLQSNHKQTALMKELTKTYSVLLQDKRVKSEQARYENFTRHRNSVLSKYKKVFQAFTDLVDGLMRAQSFYSEIKDTVESLEKNVETFVNNRRSEGAQLLNQIERDKQYGADERADHERDRLRDLMERMSTDLSTTSIQNKFAAGSPLTGSRNFQPRDMYAGKPGPISPPHHSHFSSNNNNGVSMRSSDANDQGFEHNFASQNPVTRESCQSGGGLTADNQYNPMTYTAQTPLSPPLLPNHSQHSPHPQQQQYQNLRQGYVPPPPPPGPPPTSQEDHGYSVYSNPSRPGGYAGHRTFRPGSASSQHPQNDPWGGLNAWK